ncbi:MAG: ParB/RepB/Spo0J family partition protein [Gluconacetobacter sp.]
MARTFKQRGNSAFAHAHAQALSGVAAAAPFLGEAKFKHSFEVELSKLDPDPLQPRTFFDESALEELAGSLKLHGQLQPILVRPSDQDDRRWIIVVGERRWRAASSLGWDKMLAIEFSGDRRSAMLVENIMRADLTPAEEAKGLKQVMDEEGWSQREAAAQLGLSQARISRSLRILTLPAEFLDKAATMGVPSNVLVGIAREDDPERRESLMARALSGDLTVAQVNEVRSEVNAAPREGAKEKSPSAKDNSGGRSNAAVRKAVSALLADRKKGVLPSDEDRKLLVELRSLIESLLKS